MPINGPFDINPWDIQDLVHIRQTHSAFPTEGSGIPSSWATDVSCAYGLALGRIAAVVGG